MERIIKEVRVRFPLESLIIKTYTRLASPEGFISTTTTHIFLRVAIAFVLKVISCQLSENAGFYLWVLNSLPMVLPLIPTTHP